MVPTITVHSDDAEPQQVQLKPKGTLIGRSPDCDICLGSAEVSRRHARIFRDPFGRWIIEDLGSGNGVWIGGERVGACALGPGTKAVVGSCVLVFSQEPDAQIAPDATIVTKTAVLEDAADVILQESSAPGSLSRDRMRQLDALVECITELTGPAELYPEACRCVASKPRQMAAVVRLKGDGDAADPELLALHFGGTSGAPADDATSEVHLSRRVLRAVRESGEPVIAGNLGGGADQMKLTIIDAQSPRTVCAAPIVITDDYTDALYLDIPLTGGDVDMLDFARAVARQTAFARKSLLLSEDRAQRTALDKQLGWARDIQQRLMPQGVADIPGVDIATCYRPAMWVGGDYCDLWQLPDGRVAFTVADVSGKGLPAAMVMSNLQATLRATMAFSTDVATVMEHVNRHLEQSTPDDMFATMFLGLYSPADGTLEYVNAGHMPPLKVLGGAGAEALGEASNPPVGMLETPFQSATAQLEPGAALVLVTDGITEAESPGEEAFGMDGLERALAAGGFGAAGEMVRQVVDSADAFRSHAPQADDVTVLALLNTTEQKHN